MSVRDQERRAREAQEVTRRAQQATLRALEVVRRIEVGDVQPRELPGKREDSLEQRFSGMVHRTVPAEKAPRGGPDLPLCALTSEGGPLTPHCLLKGLSRKFVAQEERDRCNLSSPISV